MIEASVLGQRISHSLVVASSISLAVFTWQSVNSNDSTRQGLSTPEFRVTFVNDESRPRSESHYLWMQRGSHRVAVDPLAGGRLASLAIDGQEVLRTLRDKNGWHWGSTVWTSPQSDWRWPPISTFDSEPFDVVTADDDQIEIVSRTWRPSQMRMRKRFTLEQRGQQTVLIARYCLVNEGEQIQKAALWENSRVNWSGQIEVPEPGVVRLSNPDAVPTIHRDNAWLAVPLDSSQPNGQKIFYTPPQTSDPITIRYRNDGILLTKQFTLASEVAPGQAPIEIYLAPNAQFAELEFQGDYVSIAPGEEASLTVTWKLVRLSD